MADLEEENTSEQATPTLTKAISTILSEVKALKEQVTTLKESVELVEVDPEVEENSGSNGRRYNYTNQGTQGNRRFHPYQRPRHDFLSKGRPPRTRLKKEGESKQA